MPFDQGKKYIINLSVTNPTPLHEQSFMRVATLDYPSHLQTGVVFNLFSQLSQNMNDKDATNSRNESNFFFKFEN